MISLTIQWLDYIVSNDKISDKWIGQDMEEVNRGLI
jgi:hypothetical protein